ncbi:MAG: hypothetical protein EZS28_053602 [Streblomastix strix]|uniref:Uncharacterized protein n=1 Tax=Streblomastix strix TaxID=222440 RepID=A0A5J4R5T9_9EUKA|nr:MAG: hypothetical protein EZS28_053602 [Streblomastix strix]
MSLRIPQYLSSLTPINFAFSPLCCPLIMITAPFNGPKTDSNELSENIGRDQDDDEDEEEEEDYCNEDGDVYTITFTLDVKVDS